MTITSLQRSQLAAAFAAVALIAAVGGYYLAGPRPTAVDPAAAKAGSAPLYYYDPMFPGQKFDKPGKSPFMDMQLVPKFADGGGGAAGASGVSVDPTAMQSLGIRLATATRGTLAGAFDVTGSIDFNQRDVAIIQARALGFVQRVYRLAPGDVIRVGSADCRSARPRMGRRAGGI